MTKYAQAHDMDSWARDARIAERGFAHRIDRKSSPAVRYPCVVAEYK